VRSGPTHAVLALAALLLVLAACGGDEGSSSGETSTVAYIVTSCRQMGAEMTVRQELRVLRGEAEEVTLLSVGPFGPFPSVPCAVLGYIRHVYYPELGPLQRFGITPDGSGIVYELSDEFVLAGGGMLPPEQSGIYYVRADGSDLRRLGPASRSPTHFSHRIEGPLAFDPAGRTFTYVDRGPDDEGHDGAQVFVQGLAPGESRRQVTRLPAVDFQGQWPEVWYAHFVDATTILFDRYEQPTLEAQKGLFVDVDGTDLREVFSAVLPGGVLVPILQIAGGDWVAGYIMSMGEVTAFDGDLRVVQLTDFGRADTSLFLPFYSPRDQRVYFTASADPFGTNPTENCQIFSVEPITRDMRQLTFFRESEGHARNGCFPGPSPEGCRVDFNRSFKPSQDPHTGTIFFTSTCDPFGQNPNGRQLFAMQPDGSGLRQLTNARGVFNGEGGALEVETVSVFLNAPYR
jgi:hypothetical protein